MAINLYLARKHGKLYPADPHNEALAWQWSFWETDRLDRQIVTYANHALVLPEAERKPEVAQAAWAEIEPALDVLESALSKTAWLAGPEFSVADLNVAAALYRGLGLDLTRWPKANAWLRLLGPAGGTQGKGDARVIPPAGSSDPFVSGPAMTLGETQQHADPA